MLHSVYPLGASSENMSPDSCVHAERQGDAPTERMIQGFCVLVPSAMDEAVQPYSCWPTRKAKRDYTNSSRLGLVAGTETSSSLHTCPGNREGKDDPVFIDPEHPPKITYAPKPVPCLHTNQYGTQG